MKQLISILFIALIAVIFTACSNMSNPIGLPETTNTLGVRLDSSHIVSVEKYKYYFTFPVYNATVDTKVGWNFNNDPFNIYPLIGSQNNNYNLNVELFNGNHYLNFGVYTIDKNTGNINWEFKNSAWFNNPNNPYCVQVNGESFFGFSAVNGKIFPVPSVIITKFQAVVDINPVVATTYQNVAFNGNQSSVSDPSQWTITDYEWNLGDGGIKHGAHVNYFYSQPGIYQIQLTITATNKQGETETAVARKEVVIAIPDLPVVGDLIYSDNLLRISYSEEADGVYLYFFFDLSLTQRAIDRPMFSGNFDGETKAWTLINGQFLKGNNKWPYGKTRFFGNRKYTFNCSGSYLSAYYLQDGALIIDGANWDHMSLSKTFNGRDCTVEIFNNQVTKVGF